MDFRLFVLKGSARLGEQRIRVIFVPMAQKLVDSGEDSHRNKFAALPARQALDAGSYSQYR